MAGRCTRPRRRDRTPGFPPRSRTARARRSRRRACLRPSRASRPTIPSVNRIYRHAEEIPRTALGADVARLRRIDLDLAPKAQDPHVDRAGEEFVVVEPREVEELVARQDA